MNLSSVRPAAAGRARARRAVAGVLTTLALTVVTAPVTGLASGSAVAAAPSDVKFEYTVNGSSSEQTVAVDSALRLRLTPQHGGVWVVQAYQWKVDGVDVPGATSYEFTPTAGHAGKKLEVDVTIQRGTFRPVTFTEVVAEKVATGRLSERPVVTIGGSAVAGQTLTASYTHSRTGTPQYRWSISELLSNPDGSTYTSDTTVGYERTLFVKKEWAGKTLLAQVVLAVPGYSSVFDSVSTTVDATVPAGYVDPSAASPSQPKPVEPPKPFQPMFVPMEVKVPTKVKSGKKVTVTLRSVSGKVTVKPAHLKKATRAKIVKGKAKVTFKAPKLKKGQKSRTIKVKVVMKGTHGNNQTRTVKVKVVR